MEFLGDILADFQDRLKSIHNANGVNAELVKIFRNNMTAIQKDFHDTGKYVAIQDKISVQLRMIDQAEKIPELADNYQALRQQNVVLVVGAFEVFMSDVFREIANKAPDYLIWPEKVKSIQIGTDSFTVDFTLGDAFINHLLRSKQYSFQDLKSTKEAIRDYLGVNMSETDSQRMSIVIGTAYRHCIAHKGSVVDKQFLNQTRAYDIDYSEGDALDVTNEQLSNLVDSVDSFSEQLVATLIQREQIDQISSNSKTVS